MPASRVGHVRPTPSAGTTPVRARDREPEVGQARSADRTASQPASLI